MSPNGVCGTSLLPKKCVTNAILLIENVLDQPDGTHHSPQRKYFPEAATMVNVKRNMSNEISFK
jgi:hypothetical protein